MGYKELYDSAKKSGAARNITPEFREWKKKGEVVIGRLRAVSEVESSLSEGTYNQYLFDTDEGLVKCAFGKATDNELKPNLRVGNVYAVTFDGKVEIGRGRTVNKFSVMYIPEESAETVGGPDDVPF